MVLIFHLQFIFSFTRANLKTIGNKGEFEGRHSAIKQVVQNCHADCDSFAQIKNPNRRNDWDFRETKKI